MLLFAPDAAEGCLNPVLHVANQFLIFGYESLFGFKLGDDGLLGGEGREGDRNCAKIIHADL